MSAANTRIETRMKTPMKTPCTRVSTPSAANADGPPS